MYIKIDFTDLVKTVKLGYRGKLHIFPVFVTEVSTVNAGVLPGFDTLIFFQTLPILFLIIPACETGISFCCLDAGRTCINI